MLDIDFPYISAILSGLLAFGLGLFWYHPKVMGKSWMKAKGLKESDIKSGPRTMVVSFSLWMLAAFFYSFLVTMLGISAAEGFGTLSAFFCVSCLLWVAFTMPPILMGGLYTGQSIEEVSIDASYHLTGYYVFALVHAFTGFLPI